MTTRLILTLALDGGDPAEVRAYAEQVVQHMRDRAAAGQDSLIEWRAGQLVDVRIDTDPS